MCLAEGREHLQWPVRKGCLFLEKSGVLGDESRGRREEGSAVMSEVGKGLGLASFDRSNESQLGPLTSWPGSPMREQGWKGGRQVMVWCSVTATAMDLAKSAAWQPFSCRTSSWLAFTVNPHVPQSLTVSLIHSWVEIFTRWLSKTHRRALLPSPCSLCSLHDRPVNQRQGMRRQGKRHYSESKQTNKVAVSPNDRLLWAWMPVSFIEQSWGGGEEVK